MTENVAGFQVRRVGFRDGTDQELAALHAVTIPIEVERATDQYPTSLASYKAFARSLPSQFDDHAWLVESNDREPVAVGFCWSNSDGDSAVMECDIFVRHDMRRHGIGSQLLAVIRHEAAVERRSSLTWPTFDAVPAGAAFSLRHGARIGRVNRTSDLRVGAVDWTMVGDWMLEPRARTLGYAIEFVDGAFPAFLRDDAARLHQIMQSAPRDDLDVCDRVVGSDFITELDRHLVESGRQRWTTFVRNANGNCVGGTEVTFDPPTPTTISQQNTGVDPEHRGLGLAKWVKAAMLARIRDELPSVEIIRTSNAFSNAAMLAINNQLGFATTSTRTEWQLRVEVSAHEETP